MKLSEYYKMIREVDGLPPAKEDPRITKKDLNFNGGKGKDGSATITFLDGAPVYLNWYIWDLDRKWMFEQIEKELGKKFKMKNMNGGQGHESCDIEIIE